MPLDLEKSATHFKEAGGSLSKASIASTEKGMAHFAATSKTVAQCRQCSHWQKRPSAMKNERKKYCLEYIRLTGDDKKSITGNAYACSHYDAAGPERRK